MNVHKMDLLDYVSGMIEECYESCSFGSLQILRKKFAIRNIGKILTEEGDNVILTVPTNERLDITVLRFLAGASIKTEPRKRDVSKVITVKVNILLSRRSISRLLFRKFRRNVKVPAAFPEKFLLGSIAASREGVGGWCGKWELGGWVGGRLEEGMDRVATDRDEPKDKDDIGVVITNGYKAIRSKTSNEFIALIDLNQGAEVAALKPLCFSLRRNLCSGSSGTEVPVSDWRRQERKGEIEEPKSMRRG
ncbi:hypothetical protein V1477_018352 [Vespula maculifrons]|uniref:Uncharacterized protein n=1 Tax=Vespula maculifrons TaxID=7453 RepID=A0ABD2AZ74_VESMC